MTLVYTNEIPHFEKLHVFKADLPVIEKLKSEQKLLKTINFNNYPHSWNLCHLINL